MESKRDWRELVALLGDEEIKPEYQKRILQILLAPKIGELPFPVNTDYPQSNNLSLSIDWRSTLKGDQPVQAAQLVEKYIPQVEEKTTDRESLRALYFYNIIVQRLIPLLEKEQAEKLFARFRINDIENWCSSYNPLKILYYDQAVDESFKKQAAGQIHEIIQKEQKGEIKPRVEYNKSVSQYSNILSSILYSKELPVSREFYQEEIAFMLGVETGKPILESWETGKVMDILDDPQLKHKFVRRQVLTGEENLFERFKILDKDREVTARRILNEFPEDQELRTYLEEQLEEWEIRSEQERKDEEEESRKEQLILQGMKR